MTRLVNEELSHIPRTDEDTYDAQAELRAFYNAMRRRDLSLGKSKEETLRAAVAAVRKDRPDAQPVFDTSFFRMSSE